MIFYRLKFLLTIFLSKNSDALNVFQMARVRVGKTIVGTYCMGSERGGKTKDALHRCLIKRQDALHGFPTWSTVVAFLNRINNTSELDSTVPTTPQNFFCICVCDYFHKIQKINLKILKLMNKGSRWVRVGKKLKNEGKNFVTLRLYKSF